ncbi:hypothetical protein BC834DRAFT_974497 [Gloeopeniophorella convolvens]|nr:hypothetical protein BC834DRAFT_974497 [Gloeopeniophorella convolvens]
MVSIEALKAQVNLNYYSIMVSIVILYYDWLVTLIDEINFFWPPKNRITLASSLYFANRYLSLFGNIPVFYEVFLGSVGDKVYVHSDAPPAEATQLKSHRCELLQHYHQYFLGVTQTLVAALCCMRVAALYEGKQRRAVVGVLVLIILGCIGASCWSFVVPRPDHATVFLEVEGTRGCRPLHTESQGYRLAVTWSVMLMFDTTVFVLTLYKALRIGWGRPVTLFRVLLRDGTLYYVVICISNLANIITFLVAPQDKTLKWFRDVNHYLALASFVILYYDYLLTLPREIEYLWPPRHRVTFASSLYFLNRYMAIFGHMPVAYEIFAASPSHQVDILSSCRSLQRFNEYYVAVSQLFAAVICLLRVSALYNSKSRRSVVIFLSTIIVATVTIACWATIVPHPHDRHIFLHHGAGGCNPLYKEKEARRMALAWSGVLVYDVAVFGLTVYKAMNVGWRRPQTLFGVMLRDGALYFVVLFFANLANAVTFLTAPVSLFRLLRDPFLISVIAGSHSSRASLEYS